MKMHIISVGTKLPQWADTAFYEYSKRLPKHMPLQLTEITTAKRLKNKSPAELMAAEGKQILAEITNNDLTIALDVCGQQWSTKQLATNLSAWGNEYSKVNFLIGGPDGLAAECLAKSHIKWSLSLLTFPHPIARLLVAEQIYRAWTITVNHPYHRE